MNKILIFLLLAGNAWAVPAQVLILRHGEKPASGIHLNERGYQRADALVSFFKSNADAVRFGAPAAMYASYKEGKAVRAVETITPTAKSFKLPVITRYEKTQTEQLAEEVLHTSRYDGKTVVICWAHQEIKSMLKHFGVKEAVEEWPDSVFDRVIVLDHLGSEVQMKNIPQRLLAGDSEK